jgi:hypothetical protein
MTCAASPQVDITSRRRSAHINEFWYNQTLWRSTPWQPVGIAGSRQLPASGCSAQTKPWPSPRKFT